MSYRSYMHLYTTASFNYRPVFEVMFESYVSAGLDVRDLKVKEYALSPVGGYGYQTASWYTSLVTKCKYFEDCLATEAEGEVAVFQDADIQLFPPVKAALAQWRHDMALRDLDVLFMREGHSDTVNGGLMIVRRTARSLHFVRQVSASIQRDHEELGEQTIINRMLSEKSPPLHWDLLPAECIVWGTQCPVNLRQVSFHHAVCTDGVKNKVSQMRSIGKRVHLQQQGEGCKDQQPESATLVACRYAETADEVWEGAEQVDRLFYNKGAEDFAPPGAQVVTLQNTGREGHAFLHYITTHYDSLPEVVVFSQARTSDAAVLPFGQYLTTRSFRAVVHGVGHGFLHANRWCEGENQGWGYIDFPPPYSAAWNVGRMGRVNMSIREFFVRHIRPELPEGGQCITTLSGTFSVHRNHILRHPRSKYTELAALLSAHPDPEIGHYFERTWAHLFMCTIPLHLKRPCQGWYSVTDRPDRVLL